MSIHPRAETEGTLLIFKPSEDVFGGVFRSCSERRLQEELIGSEYWINIIKMTTNLSRKHSEKKNSQAPNVACCIITLFFQNLGRHIVCCKKKFRYHLFLELRGHSLKVTCIAGSHEHPIISSQLLGKTKVADPTQIISIISSKKHN